MPDCWGSGATVSVCCFSIPLRPATIAIAIFYLVLNTVFLLLLSLRVLDPHMEKQQEIDYWIAVVLHTIGLVNAILLLIGIFAEIAILVEIFLYVEVIGLIIKLGLLIWAAVQTIMEVKTASFLIVVIPITILRFVFPIYLFFIVRSYFIEEMD